MRTYRHKDILFEELRELIDKEPEAPNVSLYRSDRLVASVKFILNTTNRYNKTPMTAMDIKTFIDKHAETFAMLRRYTGATNQSSNVRNYTRLTSTLSAAFMALECQKIPSEKVIRFLDLMRNIMTTEESDFVVIKYREWLNSKDPFKIRSNILGYYNLTCRIIAAYANNEQDTRIYLSNRKTPVWRYMEP